MYLKTLSRSVLEDAVVVADVFEDVVVVADVLEDSVMRHAFKRTDRRYAWPTLCCWASSWMFL